MILNISGPTKDWPFAIVLAKETANAEIARALFPEHRLSAVSYKKKYSRRRVSCWNSSPISGSLLKIQNIKSTTVINCLVSGRLNIPQLRPFFFCSFLQPLSIDKTLIILFEKQYALSGNEAFWGKIVQYCNRKYFDNVPTNGSV